MTQWNRTIGRQVTNALPAWRTAMTSTNTLYEIGGLPSNAESELVWPGAGAGNYQMSGGGDNNTYLMHHGYGCGVYVPELGTRGSFVFGSTGEGTITHQMTRFTLSDASPAWRMFQQPTYPISSAEAVAMNADIYYSVADFNALPAARKIAQSETGFAGSWDNVYPVGYQNWVFRRKLQSSLVGNNTPHFFRYDMPCYIPPAMTGESAGALVVTSVGTIYGPFAQGVSPIGMPDQRWFADVWPSNNRKHYLWTMNVQTKAWTRLATPLPDGFNFLGHIKYPHSCVDEANKRVYYWLGYGTDNALVYANFASGSANMTWSSAPYALNDLSGGAAPGYDSNAVLCVPQTGALAGKRLWYCKEQGAANLLLIDIDNNTLRRISLTGSVPTTSAHWCFSYDAASNRVYITVKDTSFGVRSHRFTIPDNYTGSYAVTLQTIALNGITLDAGANYGSTFPHGDRFKYLPNLGVICLTQKDGKMLAYRPA